MYELTYILNPNLSEEEVKVQADKIREFIVGLGGQIKDEKLGEKRKLAYEINKHNFGFYVTVQMVIASEKLVELEKWLKTENSILRHLLVTKEEEKEIPAPIRMPRIEKPSAPLEETSPKQEKAKIEEIDKKLEEILEQ
ncbi:MAG: 30S ribosomal protein S6 [Candidatus Portnoybacteria bacterium]|nr:30S ribosomal protein S6 [Candidatus Portnoybacteria bacterium]